MDQSPHGQAFIDGSLKGVSQSGDKDGGFGGRHCHHRAGHGTTFLV